MIPNSGLAAHYQKANNQDMDWWKENGLFKSWQLEKMLDSFCKDSLAQAGVSMRKEEEEIEQNKESKEGIESSLLRGLHARQHTLFRQLVEGQQIWSENM